MRKIKFRGKTLKEGKWIFGNLTEDVKGHYRIQFDVKSFSSVVIPETVGQFTGLTDKNGKEIYEGDIIKFQKYSNYDDEYINLKRHIAKVIFKEGCFCWDILKEGSQSDFHYSYKTEPLKNTCTTWGLEVISSIHDNPRITNR